jgi:clan AA aspartic protease (TIGR02281 family)
MRSTLVCVAAALRVPLHKLSQKAVPHSLAICCKRRLKPLLLAAIFIAGIVFTLIGGSLFQPAIGIPATLSQTPPTQNRNSTAPENLGEQLFQQVVECVRGKITNPNQLSETALQAASTQCMFDLVLLNSDGSVRDDASDRLTAFVQFSGVSFPQPVAKGQANIPLKLLPDSQLFTLPVQIGRETKTFLLDTGASGSIIDSQIAKQLELESTPVPTELFKYTVVGNNCSDVQVNLHPLPMLKVAGAEVEGILGMGLPQTSIPGNLSGVLGLDFLSNFDLVINPKRQELKLLPASPSGQNAIPLVGKLGSIIAQVKVNGRGPFSFLLDTGASTVVVSKRLVQQLGIDVSKAEEIDVMGFCGKEKGKKIQLAKVSLQQYENAQLDTVILENNNIFNLLGIDGIIGQNFLNKYQQHWRFGKRNPLGYAETGSLVLTRQ